MVDIDLAALVLTRGNHATRDDGMCAIEAVAWLAGEPHSDRPECVSPLIGDILRGWNDAMNDVDRQQLKPLLPLAVGTAASGVVEERRAWLAVDWLVRVHCPAWLSLVPPVGSSLRDLRRITGPSTFLEHPILGAYENLHRVMRSTGRLSGKALTEWRAGSEPAEGAVAAGGGDAIRPAAQMIVHRPDNSAHTLNECRRRVLTDDAWEAIRSIPQAVAQIAGFRAAKDGQDPREALEPTVATCQESAVTLIRRMCMVKEA